MAKLTHTIEHFIRKLLNKPAPTYAWDKAAISPKSRDVIVSLIKNQLMNKGFGSKSQCFEDLLIMELFGAHKGFIVEIGAHNGELHSNSYVLERAGWRSVLVEPNPDMAELCRQRRENSIIIQAAIRGKESKDSSVVFNKVEHHDASTLSWIGEDMNQLKRVKRLGYSVTKMQVASLSFQELADEANIPLGFDVLSVDCEGMDYSILDSIDLNKWQPKVIITEDRTTRCRNLLRAQGYVNFLITGMNMVAVHRSGPHTKLNTETYWKSIFQQVSEEI